MIFSPSLFIPHPADRTGGHEAGQDGGTTRRRFFHLPERPPGQDYLVFLVLRINEPVEVVGLIRTVSVIILRDLVIVCGLRGCGRQRPSGPAGVGPLAAPPLAPLGARTGRLGPVDACSGGGRVRRSLERERERFKESRRSNNPGSGGRVRTTLAIFLGTTVHTRQSWPTKTTHRR